MSQNAKKVTSRKKKIIVSAVAIGATAFTAALIAGSVASTQVSKTVQATSTPIVTSNPTALKAGGSVSAKIDALSPVAFNKASSISTNTTLVANNNVTTNTSSVFSEAVDQLNQCSFPWLTVFEDNNLIIQNYELATPATFDNSTLQFAAFQINNPNKDSVQFNYYSNAKDKASINMSKNQSIWVYANQDGGVSVYTGQTLPESIISTFSTKTILYSITDLNNAYIKTTNTKTNTTTYATPKSPYTSPLQVATNYLNEYGQQIITQDVYNLFNWLDKGEQITYVQNGQPLATFSFSGLNISLLNPGDVSFTPSTATTPAQFSINHGITGAINVYVDSIKTTLHLTIQNSSKLTFNITPLLMWEKDGKLQTSPEISTNTLAGTTFNTNMLNSTYPSNLKGVHLGYGINAANTQSELSLFNGSTPFKLEKIAYSYLFYYYWMANRQITSTSFKSANITYLPSAKNDDWFGIKTPYKTTFGSIYDAGNIDLQGKTYIPKTWVKAFASDSDLQTNATVNLAQNYPQIDEYIQNNLNLFIAGKKVNDLIVTPTSNPTLYKLLLDQTGFSNLNPNLAVSQFNINLVEINNVVTVTVTNAVVYNKSYYLAYTTGNKQQASINSTIYYLISHYDEGTWYYPIYPVPALQYGIKVPLSITLYLDSDQIPTTTSLNNSTSTMAFSMNFMKICPATYVSSQAIYTQISKEQSAITSSTSKDSKQINYGDLISNYLYEQLVKRNPIFSSFAMSNVQYSVNSANNTLTVTSFQLSNTTSKQINLYLNGALYSFSPFEQNFTISNFPIMIYGFTQTISLNPQVSVKDSNYPNLLLNNFELNGGDNPNNSHNVMMRKALSSLITNNLLQINDYTARVDGSSLVIDSLTLQNNSTLSNYLLNTEGGQQQLILMGSTYSYGSGNDLLSELINFKTQLSPSNQDVMNQYLDECNTWLGTLSTQDIQNDFELMGQVHQFTTNMPSQTTLNYTNYSVKISNYNPTTHSAILSEMNWDVNGTAVTGISIVPTVALSVTLQQTSPVPFKLIPMIFYMKQGTAYSYPQLVPSATEQISISGVTKDVAVSTALNYNDAPNINDITDIKYGYFLEPGSSQYSSQYAGNGLALKLGGADATYKPSLNISYAFYNFAMLYHYHDGSIITPTSSNLAYGSTASKVAKAITIDTNGINPYGAVTWDLSDVNLKTNSVSNFVQLYNYITDSANFASMSSSMDLPSGLSVGQMTLLSSTNINSIVFNNSSDITYKIVQTIDGVAYADFVYPLENNQTVLFGAKNAPLIKVNGNDVSTSSSVNLTNEVNAGQSYANAYLNATRYLDDEYGLLYGWFMTSSTRANWYGWFNSHFAKTNNGQPFDVGPQYTFTMDQPSWSEYIDSWFTDGVRTIDLSWFPGMMGFNDTIVKLTSGYKVYVSDGYGHGQLVVTGVEINDTWIDNLSITINPGNAFWLFGADWDI